MLLQCGCYLTHKCNHKESLRAPWCSPGIPPGLRTSVSTSSWKKAINTDKKTYKMDEKVGKMDRQTNKQKPLSNMNQKFKEIESWKNVGNEKTNKPTNESNSKYREKHHH